MNDRSPHVWGRAVDAAGESMIAAFERRVRERPDDPAIVTKDKALNYRAVDAMAEAVAVTLNTSANGEVLRPVGVSVRNGADSLAALLGVAKRGRIYMPLDPDSPPARLAAIAENSGMDTLLTDSDSASALRERLETGVRVVAVEGIFPHDAKTVEPRAGTASALTEANIPEFIIYTSGSTGTPKGVAHPGRYWPQFTKSWTDCVGLKAFDRAMVLYGLSVSAGLNRSLSILTSGACLCLYDVKSDGFENLAAWIETQRVGILSMPTALFRSWISVLPAAHRFGSLKTIEVATEPLYAADVERAFRHLTPDSRIVNLYGASEAGMIASAAFSPDDVRDAGILPVGNAPQGQAIEIVRDDGTPAGPDESGEILVRSPSVALGYWNDPVLSDAAFGDAAGGRVYRTGDLGRWNGAGQLLHLGRRDRKVKLRGYSVELQEVENALLRFPGVSAAVALAVDGMSEERRLVAYIAAPGGMADENLHALRVFLKSQLPEYMLPSHVVALPALPLTERGKIDRAALPPLAARPSRAEHARAPANAEEATLLAIWRDVLKLPDIRVEDGFHDLGGSSLQAFTIFARIARRFGRDLPTSTMLTAPTVAQQAAILRNERSSPAWTLPVALRKEGQGVPIFVIHAAFGSILFAHDIVRHLKTPQPVYGVQAPPLRDIGLDVTIESLAAFYIREIRRLQPLGPYSLIGYSLGGWIVFEMARQLVREGCAVEHLVMIDPIRNDGEVEPETPGVWIRRHLGVIRAMPFFEKIGYIAHHVHWKTGIRIARLRLALARNYPNARYSRFLAMVPHKYRTVLYQKRFSRATGRYEPRNYDGRVLLICARGQADAQREFWKPFMGDGLSIAESQADHKQMIRAPHAAFLAEQIDAWFGSGFPGADGARDTQKA